MAGNILLFANRTEDDIIIKDELDAMLGKDHVDIISKPLDGKPGKKIDIELLRQYVGDQSRYYYICGPDEFTALMVENLQKLGISKERIVIEE